MSEFEEVRRRVANAAQSVWDALGDTAATVATGLQFSSTPDVPATTPQAPIIDPVTHRPMPVPPGYSLQRNMDEAARHWNPVWFYNQEKHGGPWDYARLGKQYHDIGNYNYGAAGESMGGGSSTMRNILDRAAGWAQKNDHPGDKNRSAWYGPAPYGDAPDSQTRINQGFDDARKARTR